MLPKLIEDGKPQYGLFEEGVACVNYRDHQPYSVMDRRRGSLTKRFAPNQFQFVGMLSESLVLGLAIVDLKLVSNAFFYLYEPETDRLREWSFLQPLARKTTIPDTPNAGESSFSKGRAQFQIQCSGARRTLKVRIGSELSLDAVIETPDTLKPLCVCTRAGYDGWVFTQKAAGLSVVSGQLRWQERRFDLVEEKLHALYDWTAGFMRRDTFWNWSSISGVLADGRRLGVNLAAGVNETGFTENGFWLDGDFTKVDTVAFEFDRLNPLKPWRVTSFDGRIDLRFQPLGLRKECLNLILMASNFKQLFGYYEGELRTVSGETITVHKQMGFAEDHFARW